MDYRLHGKSIKDYNKWASLYKKHDPTHWQVERSAQSLASFMMVKENGGEKFVISEVNKILSEMNDEILDFNNSIGYIEHESRFDKYGKGRMQDLSIFGKTKNNKTFHLAIEAKVDEPFSSSIKDSLFRAHKAVIEANNKGKRSNAEVRIYDLLRDYFDIKKEHIADATDILNLRYQLTYFLAGTYKDVDPSNRKADVDYKFMIVLAFLTNKHDSNLSKLNKEDFFSFAKAIPNSKQLDKNKFFFPIQNVFALYCDDIELKEIEP